MSTSRRPLILLVVVVILCAAAVGVAATIAASRPTPVDTGLSSKVPPPAEYEYPRVAILGDSFTVGVGAATGSGYARVAASRLCWNVAQIAQTGTGYSNTGPAGSAAFGDPARLAEVVASDPEVIIVQGSTNDTGYHEVVKDATVTFVALKAGSPNATIVAIGPTAAPVIDPVQVRKVRDDIRAAALAAGVVFIDPIDLGWLANDELYRPDRLHPTDEGHREYADDVGAALTSVGVLTRDSCRPINR